MNGVSLLETLADNGLDPDAAPERLGEQDFEAYESQLRSLMGKLQPLPVRREAEVEAGDESDVVIIGRLGEGGMGVVELARQQTLGRDVALKRLKMASADSRQAYALLDEARIHGSLEHPNIVPVHAIGLDPESGPVVILKRVEGAAWSELLAEDKAALPADPRVLEKHLRLLMQVCNALHYAHARGVFHRDVKPSNVMVGDYGEVYLLDWGLAIDDAASVRAPSIAGTPPYMAPEMVDGRASLVDARTDVYLLGATLHELLTGRPRNHGKSLMVCLTNAAVSAPHDYAAGVPTLLAEICNRACAREKDARYPSALALHDALADFLDVREAQMLVDAASGLLERDPGSEEHSRHIDEARFATEQALRVRPGFDAAERMRERCILAAVRDDLEQDQPRSARKRIEQLTRPLPDALTALLEAKEQAAEDRRLHVEQMERDLDPEHSRSQRLRVSVAAVVVISALIALEYWLVPGGEDLGRLFLFGAGWGVLGAGPIVHGRRTMGDTAFGRQFMWILVSAVVSVVLGRLIGWLGDASPHLVFAQEVALLALLPLAVDSPLRGRHIGAAVGFSLAIGCAALPSWAQHLHALWLVFIMAVLIVDNAMPLPPRNSTPPSAP